MSRRARVLFATPEIHPLVKVGGLADVSAALPRALLDLGLDTRLLVPGYPAILEALRLRRMARDVALLPGGVRADIALGKLADAQTRVYVLDCPALFDREGGPYQDASGREWPDQALRFGALSRAAALMGSNSSPLAWKADIVHCNDWPTGLAPAFLAWDPGRRARSVMSIHNLAFSGSFPAATVAALGLPSEEFRMHGFEFHGRLSFLKAGLYYADALTTVSPTYAEEITSEALGHGLHGLLAGRRAELTGILNGIDTMLWDPARDPHLERTFDARHLERKHENRSLLRARLGLPDETAVPLIGMVSRLTTQKGVDLVPQAMRAVADRPCQLAVLGSGDRALESALGDLARDFDARVTVRLGFDESLAHQIEGGADVFLMPSRFEPCGLNQMYSMRYGTPPLVRRTGGLADTVVDTTPTTLRDGTATGFVFDEPSPSALADCITRALECFGDPGAWRRIQRNGMRRDFGWRSSAAHYRALYRRLMA